MRAGAGGEADLDCQQEEVEVEVDTGEDIFVGGGHQDGGATVCEDGQEGALGDRGGRVRLLRGAHGGRGRPEFLHRGHLDVLVVLLVVSHGGMRARARIWRWLRAMGASGRRWAQLAGGARWGVWRGV